MNQELSPNANVASINQDAKKQTPLTLGSIQSDIQEFKDAQIAQIALLGSSTALLLAILIVLIVFSTKGIKIRT